MKKSELLLNPYKEHLKKPYLHGAGTLEINGVQYSPDEYITMLEKANETLKDNVEFLHSCLDDRDKSIEIMKEENKKLKDDFMKMLYMYYNMPSTSNEIAIFAKERYSEWYDAIKDKMKEQIMKEIGIREQR